MRVVIAEDNTILAEGLGLLLGQHGFEIAATTVDGPGFVAAVERERPDVCVVDVRLPPSFRDEGIRAALEARRAIPTLPILVFSQYVEETYASELLADRRGGIGYLLKDRVGRVDDFLDALRRVAAGGTAMDPEVISQLLVRRHDPLSRLTPREREVLRLMAEGHANSAIAAKLSVTDYAIHKHISNVFDKLDLPPDTTGHRRVLAVLAYLGI